MADVMQGMLNTNYLIVPKDPKGITVPINNWKIYYNYTGILGNHSESHKNVYAGIETT